MVASGMEWKGSVPNERSQARDGWNRRGSRSGFLRSLRWNVQAEGKRESTTETFSKVPLPRTWTWDILVSLFDGSWIDFRSLRVRKVRREPIKRHGENVEGSDGTSSTFVFLLSLEDVRRDPSYFQLLPRSKEKKKEKKGS